MSDSPEKDVLDQEDTPNPLDMTYSDSIVPDANGTETTVEPSTPIEPNDVDDFDKVPAKPEASLEDDFRKAEAELKAAGLPPDTLKGKLAEKAKDIMVTRGKNALERMKDDDSADYKLATVWESLNDEGRTKWVNGETGFMNYLLSGTINAVTGPLPMIKTLFKKGEVLMLSPGSLSPDDFSAKHVKELLALGALECPQAVQAKIDHDMSSTLHGISTVASILKFVFAEAGPEIAEAEKAAKYGEKGAAFLEKLLPAVRAEVEQSRIAAEVPMEVAKEHTKEGEAVKPQVALNDAPPSGK